MFVLTTLYVSNLEESLAFYCGLLKIPLIHRFQAGPNEIAMLGEEHGTHLELIAGETAPCPSSSISIGFALQQLPALLSTLGSAVQGPIMPNPQTRFWFVCDPDGYRVQLLEA